MKKLGIVAEYNPFHNGHKYHIEEARKKSGATGVVAIMSGGFTQRGEMAVANKWTRAQWALLNGVDLVIELPVVYATSNGGYFAKGSIDILQGLGVDFISFGAEDQGDELKTISDFIQNNSALVEEKIGYLAKTGISYPRARQMAVESLWGRKCPQLDKPNNILAIEYLNHINNATPIIINREGAPYNAVNYRPEDRFASATTIRKLFENNEDWKKFVPNNVTSLNNPSQISLWQLLTYKILSLDSKTIDNIASADVGMGNRAKKIIRSTNSYDDLLEKLKSKRYTKTRISRFLMQLILGITREDLLGMTSYCRVLGFNSIGAEMLKEFKDIDGIPIVTNINKDIGLNDTVRRGLRKDIFANDMYNTLAGLDLYAYSDYVKKPIIVD